MIASLREVPGITFCSYDPASITSERSLASSQVTISLGVDFAGFVCPRVQSPKPSGCYLRSSDGEANLFECDASTATRCSYYFDSPRCCTLLASTLHTLRPYRLRVDQNVTSTLRTLRPHCLRCGPISELLYGAMLLFRLSLR